MTISVIMLLSNEIDYARYAALSVLQQGFHELIVCDTFSADGTYNSLVDLSCDRLTLYQEVQYGDTLDLVNGLIARATGDYVMHLDGDEVLSDKFYAGLLGTIEAHGSDSVGIRHRMLMYCYGYELEGLHIRPDKVLKRSLIKEYIRGGNEFMPLFLDHNGDPIGREKGLERNVTASYQAQIFHYAGCKGAEPFRRKMAKRFMVLGGASEEQANTEAVNNSFLTGTNEFKDLVKMTDNHPSVMRAHK